MPKSAYQLVTEQMQEFRKEMNTRFDQIECNFVSRKEFEPVKSIVYGLVGLILIGVASALIAPIINAQ